jgi:pyruvate dehydrogenase E2 component (dihydrolipoamide acetyltransferase)
MLVGMYGVKAAAPIVLTPQACALSLGAIIDTVIPATPTEANGDKDWATAPMLTATLSCDHRVVDGAVGAQWLSAFKTLVEDPMAMLL